MYNVEIKDGPHKGEIVYIEANQPYYQFVKWEEIEENNFHINRNGTIHTYKLVEFRKINHFEYQYCNVLGHYELHYTGH